MHRDPDPTPVPGVVVEPGPHRAGLERAALDLEALVRLGLRAGQRREQTLAQHPELELVEQPVHGLAVPRAGHEIVRRRVQRDVADQLGELAVEQHVREVRAQGVARLALHLVHPVRERLQRPELAHPLGGRLLPDPRDAGQVVARVAAQRREVGVLDRREAVAGHHRGGVDAAELGDPARRVEHRHVVADQLERVAVARGHQHAIALRLGLGGEGGDDVVGLVVVHREERDRERGQHVLDEVDLAAEVVGRRAAVRLVLGEPLGAEGDARDVEGHGDVRGHLVAQQVDEHGREAVDGVRGLPGAGAEVLRGQREERPVRERVAVEQQQAALADGVLDRRRGLRPASGLGYGWRGSSHSLAALGRHFAEAL